MPPPQPGHRTSAGQTVLTVLVAVSATTAVLSGVAALLLSQGPAWFRPTSAPATAAAPQPGIARPAGGSAVSSGAALVPPLPVPAPGRQALARRAPDGQYYFDTVLGGAAVHMMFDTGASLVMLRAEDAARAGIVLGSLDYTLLIHTANGTTDAAPVVLDALRIGEITRWAVPALVSRPGKLPVSLLGQSFMSKLSGYRFERGELVLQGD